MTTADLKRAFMDERPVRYNGITYQRVTAVIYRKTPDKTGLLVQGELLDKNGRAVTVKYYYPARKCGVHIDGLGWVPESGCTVIG